MGSLKVILKTGRDETVLWQKSGNQGNQWHLAEVSIESSVQYHVSNLRVVAFLLFHLFCYLILRFSYLE